MIREGLVAIITLFNTSFLIAILAPPVYHSTCAKEHAHNVHGYVSLICCGESENAKFRCTVLGSFKLRLVSVACSAVRKGCDFVCTSSQYHMHGPSPCTGLTRVEFCRGWQQSKSVLFV